MPQCEWFAWFGSWKCINTAIFRWTVMVLVNVNNFKFICILGLPENVNTKVTIQSIRDPVGKTKYKLQSFQKKKTYPFEAFENLQYVYKYYLILLLNYPNCWPMPQLNANKYADRTPTSTFNWCNITLYEKWMLKYFDILIITCIIQYESINCATNARSGVFVRIGTFFVTNKSSPAEIKHSVQLKNTRQHRWIIFFSIVKMQKIVFELNESTVKKFINLHKSISSMCPIQINK